MTAKSERRVITHAEAAELIRQEWERPMIQASKADEDAFDFFERQQEAGRKPLSVVNYLIITLFCASAVLLLGALTVLLVLSTTTVALALFVTGCALSLVATAMGTFAPKR